MPYGSSCSYTALHLSWMLAARLLAVGQRQKQVGELGVAVLIHEFGYGIAPAPAARLADERQRRGAKVR